MNQRMLGLGSRRSVIREIFENVLPYLGIEREEVL